MPILSCWRYRLICVLVGTLAVAGRGNALAQRPYQDLQKQVEAIQSVAQVKTQVREILESRDTCRVGSCWELASGAICEQIAMLDVRVNGKIVGSLTGYSQNLLPISPADLQLMRLMFSHCKPSNYQFWNRDRMLNVVYQPSCKAEITVRQQLGITPTTPTRCQTKSN